MKHCVKLLFLFLLLLSFSMRGGASNFTMVDDTVSRLSNVSESISMDEGSSCVITKDSAYSKMLQTLSISDVELVAPASTESLSSSNSQRLRKSAEIFSFLKEVIHNLCMRENLLALDKSTYHQDQNIHKAQSSCDYYIFALRRILI